MSFQVDAAPRDRSWGRELDLRLPRAVAACDAFNWAFARLLILLLRLDRRFRKLLACSQPLAHGFLVFKFQSAAVTGNHDVAAATADVLSMDVGLGQFVLKHKVASLVHEERRRLWRCRCQKMGGVR